MVVPQRLSAIDQKRFREILFRSLAVPMIVAVLMGIAAILQVHQLLSAAQWVDHSDSVIAQIQGIERYFNAVDAGTRGLLLTGDSFFFAPAMHAEDELPQAIDRLRALVIDNPDQSLRAQRLKVAYDVWMNAMKELVGLKNSGGDYVAAMRTGKSEALSRYLRFLTQEMIGVDYGLRARREEAVHRSVMVAEWVGGSLFFAFILVFGLSSRRQIIGLSSLYGQALEKLGRSHAELESRIRERTTELREKNRQLQIFRLLAENVKDYGIVFLDVFGNITTWTASAERLYGYSSEEVLGKHFSMFYSPEDFQAGKPRLELEEAQRHGRVEEEGWRARKNHPMFWSYAVVTPIYENGQLIGYGKISRDITEQKKLRDAQEATNRELEAFSYSVSHDLRAPLRGIDGFSKALLEDYGDTLDSTARGYLDRVRAATQRMGKLIDDILSLSRVTRTETRLERVDLSKIAKDLVSDMAGEEPGRKVEVLIESGLEVVGDSGLLRIALDNLLSNAWKFTRRKESALIEFGRMEGIDGPVYFVRDNGAGFDMTYADKLFGAFQRLHRADEFPGTGVGLATVKRIISKHGGEIWAESKPDSGSTFFFTLRRQKERQAA